MKQHEKPPCHAVTVADICRFFKEPTAVRILSFFGKHNGGGNGGGGSSGGEVSLAVSSNASAKTLTLTLTGVAWKANGFPTSGFSNLLTNDIFTTPGNASFLTYTPSFSNSDKTLTVTVSGGSPGNSITFTPKTQLVDNGGLSYFFAGTISPPIPITGSAVTFAF